MSSMTQQEDEINADYREWDKGAHHVVVAIDVVAVVVGRGVLHCPVSGFYVYHFYVLIVKVSRGSHQPQTMIKVPQRLTLPICTHHDSHHCSSWCTKSGHFPLRNH